MSIATEIKALERRIEAARNRGTPASIKAAGEMSRTLWDLKAKKKNSSKLRIT